LDKEEAVKFATKVWREINLRNLEKNILPSRSRSNLIMCKESNHKVSKIMLNI
jgi:type I pantothenate kinase